MQKSILAIALVMVGLTANVLYAQTPQGCGTLPSRLRVGEVARIPPATSVRLRTTPSFSATTRELLSAPTQVILRDGPLCQEGGYWWQVRTTDGRLEGWIVEAAGGVYLLNPFNTPTRTPWPTITPQSTTTPTPSITPSATPNLTASAVAQMLTMQAVASRTAHYQLFLQTIAPSLTANATAEQSSRMATHDQQAMLALTRQAKTPQAAQQTQRAQLATQARLTQRALAATHSIHLQATQTRLAPTRTAQAAITQSAQSTATAAVWAQYRPSTFAGIDSGNLNGQRVSVRGYVVSWDSAKRIVTLETSPGRYVNVFLVERWNAPPVVDWVTAAPGTPTYTPPLGYTFYGVADGRQDGKPTLLQAFWSK